MRCDATAVVGNDEKVMFSFQVIFAVSLAVLKPLTSLAN